LSEKFQYKLENFEGPLDLLLFLISKHKLNICDINISELLDQYTESIKGIEKTEDIDSVSEFLEMAARLVYIKTAMLLPRYDDEGEKLRQELQGELIEYKACKEAAENFRRSFCGNSIFSRAPMQIDSDNTYSRKHPPVDILKAYLSALGRKQRKLPPPVEAFSAVVHKKLVSVPSRAVVLLKRLYRRAKLKWNDLFSDYDRSECVAMFLAVLELAKSGRIYVSEDNTTVELGKNAGKRIKKEKEGEKAAAGTI